jgi:hypothetical protein
MIRVHLLSDDVHFVVSNYVHNIMLMKETIFIPHL